MPLANNRFADSTLLTVIRRFLPPILPCSLAAFKPAHKGQMEWYLNWLDQHDRLPHEEKPIGIILCAGKDHEDIEYLEMDKTGIHVAQYIMELPPKEVLEYKLKQAITAAREHHFAKQLFHKD